MTIKPDPQLAPKGAELILQVAEWFWVPCSRCSGEGHVLVHDTTVLGDWWNGCADCQGTGKLWPFRGKCPNNRMTQPHNLACRKCAGRDWLPDITYDTLRDAAVTKGWRLTIENHPEGDWIQVWTLKGDTSDEEIAHVYPADGFRGLEAILTALWRACAAARALEGVELGTDA